MTCSALRQGDEMFCARCEIRWDKDDIFSCRRNETQPATVDVPETSDAVLLRMAKAIVGPRTDAHIGRAKMLELRDHKWHKMLKDHERQDAYNAAKAVFDELAVTS